MWLAASDVDENGWARGRVALFAPRDAWSLVSPEPEGRMDAARFAGVAKRFFQADLRVSPEKRYPTAAVPLADRAEIEVETGAIAGRVAVVTAPIDRAPEVLSAARAAVAAIGGAGFDALLARGRRVWQIAAAPIAGDARAPNLVAAIVAATLLAPIVPPGEAVIFGVKTARERWERSTKIA